MAKATTRDDFFHILMFQLRAAEGQKFLAKNENPQKVLKNQKIAYTTKMCLLFSPSLQ